MGDIVNKVVDAGKGAIMGDDGKFGLDDGMRLFSAASGNPAAIASTTGSAADGAGMDVPGGATSAATLFT